MKLNELREQYPQYNNVDDASLTKAIHQKYYSHVAFPVFEAMFNPEKGPTAERVAEFDRELDTNAKLRALDPNPMAFTAGKIPLKERALRAIKGGAYVAGRLAGGAAPLELLTSAVNIESRKMEDKLGYAPGTLSVGNLEEVLQGGLDYEPQLAGRVAGGIAETYGMLAPSGQLLKGMRAAKWIKNAAKWGIGSSIREVRRGLAEHIDPDTDYGYGGAASVAYDTAFGAAMGILEGIPAKGVVGSLVKEGGISGLLMGITAAGGGETEDILVAGLIPIGLKAVGMTTRGIQRHYNSTQLKRVTNNWRMDAERRGLDTSEIPDSAFVKLATLQNSLITWGKEFKNGKVSREVFDVRQEEIFEQAQTIIKAMSRAAKTKATPAPSAAKSDIVYKRVPNTANTGPAADTNRPAPKAIARNQIKPDGPAVAPPEALKKTYKPYFISDLMNIRNLADNLLVGAGDKKANRAKLSEKINSLANHYAGIQDVIQKYPETFVELQQISDLMPEYQDAVDTFLKNPTKDGYHNIRKLSIDVETLARQYEERMQSKGFEAKGFDPQMIPQTESIKGASQDEIALTRHSVSESLRNHYQLRNYERYEDLTERLNSGDTTAGYALNALVQGVGIPTYEELLDKAVMGDARAASAIQNEEFFGGKNEAFVVARTEMEQNRPTYDELLEIAFGGDGTGIKNNPRGMSPEDAVLMIQSGQYRLELPAADAPIVSPIEVPVETEQVSLNHKQSAANAQRSLGQAKIHKIARDLGLDDVAKRDLYERATGTRSLRQMTDDEIRSVASHLESLAKDKLPFYKRPPWYRLIAPNDYSAHKMGVGEIVDKIQVDTSRYGTEYDMTMKEFRKQLDRLKKSKHPVQAKELLHLLNEYETVPAFLDGTAAQTFQWYRDLTNDILERTNAARIARGDEPIPHRDAYIKKVLIPDIAEGIIEGRYQTPKHLEFIHKLRGVKKIFNPAEKQRKVEDGIGEIFSDDLEYVTSAMLKHSLKEIHLGDVTKVTNAILQNKPETLWGMTVPPQLAPHVDAAGEMPKQTREWLQNFFSNFVEGKQTKLDEIVNEAAKDALKPVEFLLNAVGKSMGDRPATNLFGSIQRMMIYNVLGIRPKILRVMARNKLQTLQTSTLYGVKAAARASVGHHPPELKELMSQSTFLSDYQRGSSAPGTRESGRFGRAVLSPYGWTATTNAAFGARGAFYGTLEWFTNPKYKDFGWASPKRTYREPKYFLYEDEKMRMLKEMEWGAASAQYGYTPIMMPQIFRYKALRPMTGLGSWVMNYYTRFLGEAWSRVIHGRPGNVPHGNQRIPMSKRVGILIGLVLNTSFLKALGYGSSTILGAKLAFGPQGKMMWGLGVYINADKSTYRGRMEAEQGLMDFVNNAGLVLPGYMFTKDSIEVTEVLEGKRPWTDLVFYTKSGSKKPQREVFMD